MCLYQIPRQAPVHERMHPGAHLVGVARGAPAGHFIHDRDDVPARDLADAPVAPAGDDFLVEDAPGLATVLEARQVKPPVVLDHLPDGIAACGAPRPSPWPDRGLRRRP